MGSVYEVIERALSGHKRSVGESILNQENPSWISPRFPVVWGGDQPQIEPENLTPGEFLNTVRRHPITFHKIFYTIDLEDGDIPPEVKGRITDHMEDPVNATTEDTDNQEVTIDCPCLLITLDDKLKIDDIQVVCRYTPEQNQNH